MSALIPISISALQKALLLLILVLIFAASLSYAAQLKEAPKGIIESFYYNSSFSQKREICNIPYQFHQDFYKQTQKDCNSNHKLHLEKDLLLLDLKEVKTQKEAQIQQNKHKEHNVRYLNPK